MEAHPYGKRSVSVESMDEVQGSPKRPKLQSPKPLLRIPLQEWTPQQVEEAMLLLEDVPDDVTKIFQGTMSGVASCSPEGLA